MRHMVVTTLLVAGALAFPGAASARGCADAHASVAAAGTAGQAHAVLCLINHARVSHGLPRLRASAALTRAARAHSGDMVRRRYFDHTSPGGSDPLQRARRAGWRGYALGETIAYGGGALGTAAVTVRGWLDSPPHRRILLRRGLREIGIGVATGMPDGEAGDGMTVTADVGAR